MIHVGYVELRWRIGSKYMSVHPLVDAEVSTSQKWSIRWHLWTDLSQTYHRSFAARLRSLDSETEEIEEECTNVHVS